MRNYSILLIIAIVLLTSCNPDDGQPPLTPDLVTSIRAFDLDNNGNSSDIRVEFIVENNLNVREYRVMILQSKDSSLFTLDVASSIPEQSYIRNTPESFKTEYSIPRLPSTPLDVNGAPIINGVEYVVAILVEGTAGNFQLSEFSRPFTLREQGIYAGYYEGSGCCLAFSSLRSFSIQVSVNEINYSGAMEVITHPTDTTISIITFKIVNELISDFKVSGGQVGDYLLFFNPGSGMVTNDLLLEIHIETPLTSATYDIQLIRVF